MMEKHNPIFKTLGLACVLAWGWGPGVSCAEHIQMESAVVESASGKTSAVSRSDGNVSSFFELQKKIVYDTLQGLGISLDSLPAGVRAKLAQFHTQNLEAFRAFSSGLNAQDEGKFAEAKAYFKRAAELDPAFSMARELEIAMPQSDARNSLQFQAVLRDAVKNATQGGKQSVATEVARAALAMQQGMTVVVGAAPPDAQALAALPVDSLANPSGSGEKYGVRSVVGMSYTLNNANSPPVGVASTTDWNPGQVTHSGNDLVSVGDKSTFTALVGGASPCVGCSGQATLTDGSVVNWGGWNSTAGASAAVTVSGTVTRYPQLGALVTYMVGPSTLTMPTTGTATFVPTGGNFSGASGSISADFGARQVQVNNLAFTLGSLGFTGLNGQASYASSGSGFFSGNYSSGSCSGCSGFSPTASAFTGNFVGGAANGLILSSILQTGAGTVSGVNLFSR